MKLWSVVNGNWYLLDETPVPLLNNTWYSLRVEMAGTRVRVYMSGAALAENKVRISSLSSHPSGKIGLRTRDAALELLSWRHLEGSPLYPCGEQSMSMLSPYLRDRYAMLFPGITERELCMKLEPCIRANELRISPRELVQRLEERGFELERIPWLRCGYRILRAPFSPGATPEYLLGYYYLQDAASMYACEALEPRRDELVLDCASAPGGKTTYIAQLMRNTGCVVALELKRQRLKALRANLNRMGVENTLVVQMDARHAPSLGLRFDRVLLDAPCTGTGTAHRNPEALQKSEEDIKRLAPLQLELLRSAYAVLREGGLMVYSTCSYLPEENELVLDRFLQESGARLLRLRHGSPALTTPYGVELRKELGRARRFYPWEHRTQGFFIAKIRK